MMFEVQIFTGTVTSLPGNGRPTAMLKKPVTGSLQLGLNGFAGDQQADRRVHGGPEKAVHLYPADHYIRLAQRFPEVADQLVPGSLGENLSTDGLTEADVCIGDVFSLGEATMQICQPRSPCWKIDCRFDLTGIAAHIAETGMTGWYWRVLQPGRVDPGDTLCLAHRPQNPITLAAAMAIMDTHRPPLQDLERLAGATGIAAGWRKKILGRLDWLQRQPELPLS